MRHAVRSPLRGSLRQAPGGDRGREDDEQHRRDSSDGRVFSIINKPLTEGGWIATREDIICLLQRNIHECRSASFPCAAPVTHDGPCYIPHRRSLPVLMRTVCDRRRHDVAKQPEDIGPRGERPQSDRLARASQASRQISRDASARPREIHLLGPLGVAITATDPSGVWGLIKEGMASGWPSLKHARTLRPWCERLQTHFASGSGRIWNFTTFGRVPLPVSRWNGVRVP